MKNSWLIVLAAVVALLSIYLIFTKHKSTFNRNDTQFAFAASVMPDEIKLSGQGSAFKLVLRNNNWYINDETEAKPQLVKLLIGSLENLQMDYPVSEDMLDPLKDSIINKGTSVTFLRAGEEIYQLQLFDFKGKTVALNRKGFPFYISVKGYSNLPIAKVATTEKNEWIAKLIINLKPEEIRSIKLSYKSQPAKNFQINLADDKMHVLDYDGKSCVNVLQQNITDYTHFFAGIGFENRDSVRYSIDSSNELFLLTIVNTANQEISIKGLPIIDISNGEKDVNNFAGIVNNYNVIFLKYSDFDPILTSLDNFLKK